MVGFAAMVPLVPPASLSNAAPAAVARAGRIVFFAHAMLAMVSTSSATKPVRVSHPAVNG
jgi:hypothetical protein